MSFTEYESYDALGLAELVRNRDVSALEVVDAAIARAEALNPTLNAIVFKAFVASRERATYANTPSLVAGLPTLL